MSLLVLQIPPRPRLRARDQRATGGPDSGTDLRDLQFVWSVDTRQVTQQGRAAVAQLPKADTVVAVLSPQDIAWQRITLPKAPPARLRAALAGVLEEALLDDGEATHLALAPGSKPGELAWVAAVQRAWLVNVLSRLELAQVFVDRVVPAVAPTDAGALHFYLDPVDPDRADALCLSWSHADGVSTLGTRGGLARVVLPQPLPDGARCTTTPAAAAAAEAWLGAPVPLRSEAEALLDAAASAWNLRQFELTRRHRGSRALRDLWLALLGPQWRPVRYGLVSLLAVQLVGLNAWAWQLRSELERKKTQRVAVLQTTFPNVKAVLDAPLQMEREVQQLRQQAGRVGDGDLETLLNAAAAAWPPGRAPVDKLRYEPGRLSLAAPSWSAEEVDRFGGQLRASGYRVEQAEGQITLTRAPRGARS